MWDVIIVIAIVAVAAGAIGWSIYRAAHGDTGCNCGAHNQCPFNQQCGRSDRASDDASPQADSQ